MKKRTIWESLIWEQNGDMNLSQLLCVIFGLVGIAGFIWVNFLTHAPTIVILSSWIFLIGAFASLLICSVPLAKSKILAHATLPGSLTKSIAELQDPLITTDVQEGWEKKHQGDNNKDDL